MGDAPKPAPRDPSSGGAKRSGGGRSRSRNRSGRGGQGQRSKGGANRSGGSGRGSAPAARDGRAAERRRAEARAETTVEVVRPSALAAPAMGPGVVDERVVQANRRRAHAVAVGAGLVPGIVVGVVLTVVLGLIAGAVGLVVVTAFVAVAVGRRASGRVLSLVGGAPLDDADEPRLANVVDGLCATFGVPRPKLWLVDDPVPNACTVGKDPGSAVLVVTTGLLETLGLIELEGVVAHELAHVKRHDTGPGAVAVAVSEPVVRLTGNDRLAHTLMGRGREYAADRVAVATVRYPPGLAAALAAMASGPAPLPGSVFVGSRWVATRWLWVDPMVGARSARLEGELDATDVRRSALAEW